MITIFGIPNCDTIKKARKWLDGNDISYQFHDLRDDGLSAKLIEHWFEIVGWEILINKRSTTWRQLKDEQKEGLDESRALSLLLENPTLIKRPVFDNGLTILVGFSEESYQSATSLSSHLTRKWALRGIKWKSAAELLLDNPMLIKHPMLDNNR